MPDAGEIGIALQRHQRHQPRLDRGDVVAEEVGRGGELVDFGRDGNTVARGNLAPQVDVAPGQVAQRGGAGLHAGQQAVAHLRRGVGVHQALGGPHPQALLVGRELEQLGEDVAGEPAVRRVVVDAIGAPIDEAGLDADERHHQGKCERKPDTEHENPGGVHDVCGTASDRIGDRVAPRQEPTGWMVPRSARRL